MGMLEKRIVRRCLRWITLLFYGNVVQRTIRGIRYELDLSEQIDSSLFFRGYYESGTTELLRRYVSPDMVVFEIGANIGAHTFRIAQRLSTGSGRLYSFEPTVYAFTKLERNFALNQFDNIVLERVALSDVNKEETLHRASSRETMPFQASWDKRTHRAKSTSIDTITFRKLDDYLEEKQVKRLDLLKIDTDGYELRVLKGGLQAIRTHRPIMVIELGTYVEHIGDSLEELVATIQALGYSIHSVETAAEFEREELFETVRRRQTMDCLCLPKAA